MKDQATPFSYAVFSFSPGDPREASTPIGVALWSSERSWMKFQFVKEDDRLQGFSVSAHYHFIDLVSSKIEYWESSGVLPYVDEPLLPTDDRWWDHVKNLLIHRIRLSDSKPIACSDPDKEFERLYKTTVPFALSSREIRSRIESHVRDGLGGLAKKFNYRQEVLGYGGRPVKVMRSFKGRHGWVFVEGLNLNAGDVEAHSDAVASRLQRLTNSQKNEYELILGYLPPDGGLNGEAPLIDWIRQATGAKIFDLNADKESFQQEATRCVNKMDGQSTLPIK